MSRFILRLDDVSPGMDWARFEMLAEILHRSGVKPVVGVIPACADPSLQFQTSAPDFWDRVRGMRDSGWSIAQHGFTHVCDSTESGLLGIGRHSEFAGHSVETQSARGIEGKRILKDEGCWQPIFMAPAHSYDDVTLQVLAREQFTAVTDGYGFSPYMRDGLAFVPQMFSRPYHFGVGTYTICVHTNSLEQRLLDRVAGFVTRHRRQFITFQDAVESAQESLAHQHLARQVTGSFMRTARLLRYPSSRKPIPVESSLPG